MSAFKTVAKVSELKPGEKKGVRFGLSYLLLTNVDGNFYAVGGRCTHLRLSLINGNLEGKIITCPHHGSQFDVTTGKVLKGPATKPLPTFEIKVEGDDVLVGKSSA